MNNKKDDPYQRLGDEMKQHPGFGKPLPLHLFSGDVYSNFVNTAREAGFLPPFVELQREIKGKLQTALKWTDESKDQSDVKKLIDEINEKIKKYNLCCPPRMQKMPISLETVEQQSKQWE